MAEAVYILCTITCLACALLLTRAYRASHLPLLFWSGLCFFILAVANALLFVDLVIWPDVDLSVQVCHSGKAGGHIFRLPVLDDRTNKPCLFSFSDQRSAQLIFKIFCAKFDDGNRIDAFVGSGVALLANLYVVSSQRESLIRHHTIPILEKDTLDFIGALTFSFLIVTPYLPPRVILSSPDNVWRRAERGIMVGHRGIFLSKFSQYKVAAAF